MIKLLKRWLSESIYHSLSTRLIDTHYRDLEARNDTGYPTSKLWPQVVQAACDADEYVHVEGKTLLIPADTAERWAEDPTELLLSIDISDGIEILSIQRDGFEAQYAVSAPPKLLKRLRGALPKKTKRKVILFGFTRQELLEALGSL